MACSSTMSFDKERDRSCVHLCLRLDERKHGRLLMAVRQRGLPSGRGKVVLESVRQSRVRSFSRRLPLPCRAAAAGGAGAAGRGGPGAAADVRGEPAAPADGGTQPGVPCCMFAHCIGRTDPVSDTLMIVDDKYVD